MIAKYKSKHTVEITKGKRKYNAYIYVFVQAPKILDTGIRPSGYYAAITPDGFEIERYKFSDFISFTQINQIEDHVLQDFENQRNSIAVIYQRTKEFTMLRIEEEYLTDNTNNWGLRADDFEEVID